MARATGLVNGVAMRYFGAGAGVAVAGTGVGATAAAWAIASLVASISFFGPPWSASNVPVQSAAYRKNPPEWVLPP